MYICPFLSAYIKLIKNILPLSSSHIPTPTEIVFANKVRYQQMLYMEPIVSIYRQATATH